MLNRESNNKYSLFSEVLKGHPQFITESKFLLLQLIKVQTSYSCSGLGKTVLVQITGAVLNFYTK
jgi:hypothetical protein